jgi:hypothetical protein
MKKIILATILAGSVVGSTMGQGVVTFTGSAFSGRGIYYSTDDGATTNRNAFAVGAPSSLGTFGNLNIAMYAASAGTVLGLLPADANGLAAPNLSAWKISTPLVGTISTTPAQVNATPFTLDASLGAAASGPVEVEIVGWTGSSTTFTQALAAYEAGTAAIGWSGELFGGQALGALGWQLSNTGSGTLPFANATGAAAYNGLELVTVVPEPGTILLGGLGAASLLLFRRRK